MQTTEGLRSEKEKIERQRLREKRWLDSFNSPNPVTSTPADHPGILDPGGRAGPPIGGPAGRRSLFKSQSPTGRTENASSLGKTLVWDSARELLEGEYYLTVTGGAVHFTRYDPLERRDRLEDLANDALEVWDMKPKPKRERIKEFSNASRRRFCQKLAQVRWSDWCQLGIVVHANLTYPEDFPSPSDAKVHLEAFRERIRRRYGESVAFSWKLEPQERGAPHIHLLGGFLQSRHPATSPGRGAEFQELREFIIRAWLEVVGSDDPRHARHHWRDPKVVQWVQDRGHVVKYLGKYQGKPAKTEGWDWPGRFWGLISGEAMQDHYVRGVVVRVDRETWYTAKRLLRKHGGPRSLRHNRAARSYKTWRAYLPESGEGGLRTLDGIINCAMLDPLERFNFEGFI
jgi:hypothetical protein